MSAAVRRVADFVDQLYAAQIGLSPRVWGHLTLVGGFIGVIRSISACAESSKRSGPSRSRRWVYLRVCGVICPSSRKNKAPVGLSPRVRSHLLLGGNTFVEARSISACAESSRRPSSPSGPPEVYLRVCGVIFAPNAPWILRMGLSPRVRSHPHARTDQPRRTGSISACAESSRRRRRPPRPPRVYLRVCGVIWGAGNTRSLARGLSPRVRSHRLEPGRTSRSLRSISACAESSAPGSYIGRLISVYLRVCGVIRHCLGFRLRRAGLSPRVRSHPNEQHGRNPRRGSISACAESSCPSLTVRRGSRVYLRVCGVIVAPAARGRCGRGLSPRVRSHPEHTRRVLRRDRSISACAESSRPWAGAARTSRVYLRVCGVIPSVHTATPRRGGLSPRVRSHPS